MTVLFEGITRAQMIRQIHLETDTSAWCYGATDAELIEGYAEIFGLDAGQVGLIEEAV